MWLETPVHSADIAATIEVARAIRVPVATGERYRRPGMFVDLLAAKVVDILQPDVVNCGGITEMRKIAVFSDTFSKDFVQHQTQPRSERRQASTSSRRFRLLTSRRNSPAFALN